LLRYQLAYWCARCQKTHYGTIADDVRQVGLNGPGLTTLIAYLKGACHCSFFTMRKFVPDVLGLQVSRGYLAKLIAKVSDRRAVIVFAQRNTPGRTCKGSARCGHK
jgi:hypothetical protein